MDIHPTNEFLFQEKKSKIFFEALEVRLGI